MFSQFRWPKAILTHRVQIKHANRITWKRRRDESSLGRPCGKRRSDRVSLEHHEVLDARMPESDGNSQTRSTTTGISNTTPNANRKRVAKFRYSRIMMVGFTSSSALGKVPPYRNRRPPHVRDADLNESRRASRDSSSV